jgi:MFS family permease
VLWALIRIQACCTGGDCTRTSIKESLGDGFHFITHDRLVFVLFWMAAITSLLARPYLQLMPVIAESVLHGGPRTYGTLMAANGVGALIGALLTASLTKLPRTGLVLLASALVFGVALVGFASSRNLALSLILLAVIGGGTTLYMGATNTVLLTQVTDEMRGRVMSMYSLIGAGVMPVGALVLGGVASAVANAPLVIATGGVIVAANALMMAIGALALRKME